MVCQLADPLCLPWPAGEPLGEEDVTSAHYERVCQLQRLAFKHIPQLRELALANCGAVEKRDSLRLFLQALSEEQLRFLVGSGAAAAAAACARLWCPLPCPPALSTCLC
jgi:hypothetical protein